jgi:hypothetical protein
LRHSLASTIRMFVQEEGVKSLGTSAVRRSAIAASTLILCCAFAMAQETVSADSASSSDATRSAVRGLQEQVDQLRALVDEMHTENVKSRAEMQQLRRDLQTTRSLLERSSSATAGVQTPYGTAPTEPESRAAVPGVPASTSEQAPGGLEERVQKLEESTSLLGSKVNEQYGTKVESASKYRTRLSGIVLMNAFRNVGATNNLDFPDFAQPVTPGTSAATIGATLRQSEIGLEIFGPNLGGAKTSANIQLDFAGGFAATGNGVNFGIVRLQTASLRFDWEHTSVVAGQDSLFLSPLSPTSFATLAIPTFAYAGNLWGWTPQLRVEHRFNLSDQQTFTVQAGVLDNLDWEFPADPFYRAAQSGEQSGQPAYGAHAGWSKPVLNHVMSLGVAGYYGRQDWSWGRYVDAWAGMADWQIPLLHRLVLSGEFYRGRGIGGLGGAVGRSIVYNGDPGSILTPIRGLNATGGWSQLKFQVTSKVELNGVFAEDNAFAGDVRGFATDHNNFGPILGRNRGMLGNVVYRPRSDLLFAAEFRRLRSFPVYSNSTTANQVNLAVGILF